MSKEQKITGNIQPPNKDLEILKQNFPNCFDKKGEFDFEKFQTQLSKNEINFSKESYGMDWLGKSYARLLATDETTTLLKEDETFNQKEENKNSENLLIKGDNLEVLKHLSNAYNEKIKMIYIDPPYNTGSDGFVYADDRKFTVEELQELAGVNEERAKRILDFTQSKSNSHSAWLTFIYPRFYIAKQLLKENGAIFISIDDNEASQLKVILDEEIFGEENFIAKVPAIMNLKGNQDNFGFADCHEYFLVYAKDKDKCELFEFDIEEDEIFNDWNEDEYGLWKKADGLRRTGDDASRINRPKGWFPVFITPEDEIYVTDDDKPLSKKDTILYPINDDEEELSWSWGKPKIKNETYNLIVTDARSGGKSIYKKQRPKLGDLPTKKPKSFFYKSDYSTSTSTTQLKKLFGKKVFKGPKPVPFIMDLLTVGMSQDDTVLDFFGGSGTTGEAVMRLNLSDEGSRKYIMVQLPELLDSKKNKIAYDYVKNELKINTPTVFDITKQRLILSSEQIKKDYSELDNQDISFKIFETVPIWEDYGFESEELEKQTSLFDESKLTQEDIKALLVTWKTYDGVPLTKTIQETNLNGYIAHYSNEKLYLMDKGFTTENLKVLLEKIDSDKSFNPTTIIAFGYHFESKSLREISENIKSYANKKSIDIDFITRY